MSDFLQGTLLCGALIGMLIWVIIGMLAPVMVPAHGIGPRTRERTARALLYAPFWIPVCVMAATVMPGVIGVILTVGESCSPHGVATHHHICSAHQAHVSGWVIAIAVVTPAAMVLVAAAWRIWSEWTLARTLRAISRASNLGPQVCLLDRPEAIALTVGWRCPTILLSTGLVNELSDASIDVVIAHERAHIERRDTWFGAADRFAASLLPRAAGRALIRQIVAAREQACDEIAATRIGSRTAVAEVLDEVRRMQSEVDQPTQAPPVSRRIERLLRPEPDPRFGWTVPVAFFASGLVIGAGPLHALAERMVGVLLH